MSASANDKVRNAAPNFATTLGASMSNVDVTATLAAVTGLPTGTGVTLTIDATNAAGIATPSVKETVTGVVSGSTITNLLRGQDGTSAQAHSTGANVVMWITANLWNDFQTAFLANHEQLHGYHASLTDVNGNSWIDQSATVNAVNRLQVANAATGNYPVMSAVGSDTNVDYGIVTKGSGVFRINGVDVSGGWQPWVPTRSNITVGNGVEIAKYKQVGKTIEAKYMLTLGSTSAIGTQPRISFPVAPAAFWVNEQSVGMACLVNTGIDIYPAQICYITPGVWLEFRAFGTIAGTNPVYIHSSSATLVDATHPFAWAAGTVLSAQFTYESA